MSLAQTLFRRSIAGAAIGALALSGAVALAPTATAAPADVSAAELKWGFKESWRNYIGAPGQVIRSEGLQVDPSSAGSTDDRKGYLWPGATGGTYDSTTGIGTIPFAGKVTYVKEERFLEELSFSNLTVELDGDGTGAVLADVTYLYGEGAEGTVPVRDYDADQVPIVTLSAVPTPSVSDVSGGSRVTYTGATTTLTQIGSDAFGGFYAATPVIDPLTISFTVASTRVATTTSVAVAPAKVTYGKPRTATVTVAPVGGGATPTGSVTVRDNGAVVRTVALSGGRAVVALPSTQRVGSHSISASYAGSALYLPSTRTATSTVVKATSVAKGKLVKKKIKAGKKAKVKVTVNAGGVAPTGKVTIRKGKKVLKRGTVRANGKATITLPKQKKKGTVKLKVVYAGNANVAGDTSPVFKLKVKKK